MNLVKQCVEHDRFGSGIIVWQSASMIEVLFDGKAGSKKFLYPTSLVSFLQLSDASAKKAMLDENAVILKQAEKRRREYDEARLLLLEQTRAAAEKKPKPKARPRIAKPKTAAPEKTAANESPAPI